MSQPHADPPPEEAAQDDAADRTGDRSGEQAVEQAVPRRVELFSWKIVPLALITAAVLYLLISRFAGRDDFLDTIARADWTWLAAAAGLFAVNLLLAGFRLVLVMRAIGYEVPLLRSLDAMLATWPFAVVTPSRAGDLLRAVALRDLVPPVRASGALVAEKMVDVQSLCLLALVGSVAMGLWLWAALAAAMLLGVWAFSLGVLLFTDRLVALPVIRRAEDKVRLVLRVFHDFRERPSGFLAVAGTSLLGWIIALVMVLAIFEAFDAGLAPARVFGLWPLALFAGMLPLTVAGLGTRDAAFLSLLAASSTTGAVLPEAAVLAGTVTYAALTTVPPALLGLPLTFRHMADFRKVEKR